MSDRDAPTTFLMTDIEGSTRLWETDPEAMRAAHERHLDLIERSVTRHGGRLLKARGEGDSTFCVFASAACAAAAAHDAQRDLQSEPWPEPALLRVRMALHTGVASALDGDYHSTHVNRCARLRAIAHGEQILVSGRTRELALEQCLANDSSSPRDTAFVDLGIHRLRDLQEPESVYQLTGDGLRTAFPPLDSLDSRPNNLPRQLTSFVGRTDAIADVSALVQSHPLVTLTGVGGVGKTRLALQAAAEQLHTFRYGVWFVDLAPLADPGQVPRTLATVLGVREDPGRPVADALLAYLRTRELLLVIDNCEHLLDACARLATDILLSCPGARILATSREPLSVSGEAVFRVSPLGVPSAEEPVERMMESDCVRLFVERARLRSTRVEFTPANAPVLLELCRHLDGIPLAIELAAARTRAMSLEQILARIDTRFQMLASSDRGARQRHQTLRALIDWSYDLLTLREQIVLRRLSVFAGEFSLEDAEAVLADSATAPAESTVEVWQVGDILMGLVDKSLLNFEHDNGAPSGEGRYRALETIRQYGREKLAAAGEEQAVQLCHCDYYLARAEEHQPPWNGTGLRSLQQLQAMYGEVRAAINACAMDHQPPGTERVLRFASVLWFFWIYRSYYREGNEHTTDALARADASRFPVPWAKAMVGHAALAYYLCDDERCITLCHQALPICREHGLHFQEALCLCVIGTYSYVTGDISEAGRLWQESYALAERAGDPWVRSISSSWLGDIALASGDSDAAVRNAEEGLALAREAGEPYIMFHALFHLGLILHTLGLHDRAQALLQEALSLCHRTGHSLGATSCLEGLATVEAATGGTRSAARLLGGASAIRRAYSLQLPAAFDMIRRQITDHVRSSMPEADFLNGYQNGEALAPQEIISAALGEKENVSDDEIRGRAQGLPTSS